MSSHILRHTTVENEYQWETMESLLSIYRIFTYYPELRWNLWKMFYFCFKFKDKWNTQWLKKKKKNDSLLIYLKSSAKLEQSQVLMCDFSKDNSVVNRKSEMDWLVARVWITNLSCIFSRLHSPETEECWKNKSTLGGDGLWK